VVEVGALASLASALALAAPGRPLRLAVPRLPPNRFADAGDQAPAAVAAAALAAALAGSGLSRLDLDAAAAGGAGWEVAVEGGGGAVPGRVVVAAGVAGGMSTPGGWAWRAGGWPSSVMG
jgi:hypothetical protein